MKVQILVPDTYNDIYHRAVRCAEGDTLNTTPEYARQLLLARLACRPGEAVEDSEAVYEVDPAGADEPDEVTPEADEPPQNPEQPKPAQEVVEPEAATPEPPAAVEPEVPQVGDEPKVEAEQPAVPEEPASTEPPAPQAETKKPTKKKGK